MEGKRVGKRGRKRKTDERSDRVLDLLKVGKTNRRKALSEIRSLYKKVVIIPCQTDQFKGVYHFYGYCRMVVKNTSTRNRPKRWTVARSHLHWQLKKFGQKYFFR